MTPFQSIANSSPKTLRHKLGGSFPVCVFSDSPPCSKDTAASALEYTHNTRPLPSQFQVNSQNSVECRGRVLLTPQSDAHRDFPNYPYPSKTIFFSAWYIFSSCQKSASTEAPLNLSWTLAVILAICFLKSFPGHSYLKKCKISCFGDLSSPRARAVTGRPSSMRISLERW